MASYFSWDSTIMWQVEQAVEPPHAPGRGVSMEGRCGRRVGKGEGGRCNDLPFLDLLIGRCRGGYLLWRLGMCVRRLLCR